MRKHIGILTAALLCTAAFGLSAGNVLAAAAATPQERALAAYKAAGMSDVKLAPQEIVALVIKGRMQAFDPGESESVADPYKPDWGVSTFTETFDNSRGLYRVEWQRPRANGGMRNYTEIFSDQYGTKMGGYVMGIDVNGGQPARAVNGNTPNPSHTVSGARLAAELRELERNNIIDLMHLNPDRVSAIADQTADGKTYPAVQYRGDYGNFIVLFDTATSLPAVVRTRDFDFYYGDSDYDETLSDWRDIGRGVKMPFHQVVTVNGTKIFDTTLTEVTFNPQLAVDAFTVPAALRGKAAPPAPANQVKYQWILRRMGNGFYLDSDAYYTDDGASIRLVDVGPNISHAVGGSHNTLIVATNDGLVAFEAPGDDGLSKVVMDLAQAKYPGKTWKYVVLTHHHIDHTGGVRAYAAAGAQVVVGKGDGDFYRKVLAAPQTLNTGGPQRIANPQVIEVDGKWSVTEGGRTIEAYSLDTPHATGYLIPYVPDAKLGFVTDIWSPAPMIPPANPQTISLVKGIQKMGIQVDKMAGGHGGVGNFADLAKTVP